MVRVAGINFGAFFIVGVLALVLFLAFEKSRSDI